MLVAITLENYALADQVEVHFEKGFNVITGETGAGKSLILDALALCTGARADANKVRHGAKKTEIYVEFDIQHLQQELADWFKQQDIELETEILIRRQILANGRSKAWINGQLVSITDLKKLSTSLVQMHSQHAQTALLKSNYMIDWLDNVANKKFATLNKKFQMHRDWKAFYDLQKKLADSKNQRTARKERIRLLTMQLEDVLELSEYNYVELEQEYDTLCNYEQLMQEGAKLLSLLDTDDDVSIQQLISQSLRISEQQSQDSFTHVTNHLHNAMSEINDAIAFMQDFASQPEPDSRKLQQLDSLLNQFHRLSRKYEIKPQELAQLAEKWSDELLELESVLDEDSQKALLSELKNEYINSAQTLNTARKKASAVVCKQLLNKLKPLSLENAQCEFVFTENLNASENNTSETHALEKTTLKNTSSSESNQPLNINEIKNAYHIEFQFSANKGMPLQPLHKQASGGELSRIALVMHVLNASDSAQSLMVFDEIDVGMSGGTAEIIGELMQDLGQAQQILTITHQAQVASKADNHFLVTKSHTEKQTHSQIVKIDDDDRINELARMSGGVQITESTIAHAKSLLK